MANFLGPYWVQINYHSVYAPHTMTIPTRTWNPDGGFGTFEAWDSSAIAADTMILDMIEVMLPYYHSSVSFDNWVIFKQLLPTDDIQPVMSKTLTGEVGTDATPGWYAAVEQMFIARTASFGLAKLVLLDSASHNDFNPRQTFAGADADLVANWGNSINAWAGRDNAQVVTPIKITLNINDKLRKEYRLD